MDWLLGRLDWLLGRLTAQPQREQQLSTLLALEAQERFLTLRTNRSGGRWRGFSGLVPAKELTSSKGSTPFLWQLTTEGAAMFNGQRPRNPARAHSHTDNDQVPVPLSMLRFQGRRPVWDDKLIREIRALPDTSPKAYPHAALDIIRACDEFAMNGKREASFAVWSSITPWLEVALLRWGASAVTTVDWNQPLIEKSAAVAAGGGLRTMDASSLAASYARGTRFDVIVSFSGLEHDGLGRYGDPLHPEGDLAAVTEIRSFLTPGGLLLLGIPTANYDDVNWPSMRIYGPARLPRMLEGFEMLGRVWNGTVVRGGLKANKSRPPLLTSVYPIKNMLRWQHQHVLVLRRTGDNEAELAANEARELTAEEREARLRRVRSRLKFGELRRAYPGWSTSSIEMRQRMPPELKAAYVAVGGSFCLGIIGLQNVHDKDAAAARLARHAKAAVASVAPLRFDGRRPIWNDDLLRVLERRPMRGNLALALQGAGIQRLPANAAVAVVSGLLPTAELQLLQAINGGTGTAALPITCIGWSAPAVRGQRASTLFRPLNVDRLAERHAEGERFDLIVSVSGALARDGLGLWGDPLHPDGDIASMREYQQLLAATGTLIVTVPVAAHDAVADWPTNDSDNATTWLTRRVYGPARLPQLLHGYRLLSCVAHGAAVPLQAASSPCSPGGWSRALSALRTEQNWTLVLKAARD